MSYLSVIGSSVANGLGTPIPFVSTTQTPITSAVVDTVVSSLSLETGTYVLTGGIYYCE